MRKILIFVYSVFLLILLSNFIYYKSLYNKQIGYITTLLDRQVQIMGISVDDINNQFSSDLNRIGFSDDLGKFFMDKDKQYRVKENIKLFFSKYQDFVTGIKVYDNNKNEFTIRKDDQTGEWLEQQFILHSQGEIISVEQLVKQSRNFEYFLPVFNNESVIGNIVVTVDYNRYFNTIFSEFNLKDYQWQWVIADSGEIIYNNYGSKIIYDELDKITSALGSGSVGHLVHKAVSGDKPVEIISSYYSTRLLQRDLGLLFSAPTQFFQKYIIRNSVFIVSGTLLLVQLIIILFWRYIRSARKVSDQLRESEKMLFRTLDEMPAGIIIHRKNREIIKANKVAATLYSYSGEDEMKGKVFSETTVPEMSEYFSKNLGGVFNPNQFVIIKKDSEELILFRNSVPLIFMGEEAEMEVLIDVTMLESARKKESKANIAKSEFLSRMSYEIRTPLNGIIGITDILAGQKLSAEERELINILRRSSEVIFNITNEILDFSKIETGKLILDEVAFNLREEINYCAEIIKPNIPGGVAFTITFDDKVQSNIIADPSRLRQVLISLLNHSASGTSEGEIRLSCKQKAYANGMISLVFDLSDTGRKYDDASLKRIFGDTLNVGSKVFKQGDESEVGTILARQIIRLMGGNLTAESPSGLRGDSGTKISFSIIAYPNDKVIKDIGQENIRSFTEIKTLVITASSNRDEDLLLSLHKLGLNVSVTTYQKSTVSQIKSNLSQPADKYRMLIILDEIESNGFEAAETIWENDLSGNIIILIISSNDRKGNYLKCITLGIDHYLVKPFGNDELINCIRESFPSLEQDKLPEINILKRDLKILIVEDNKMNQIVIGKLLETLGYTFDIAEDGYEGYLKAKARRYDLIFMDLILPELSGYESARKILDLDKSILIVAFTADNMPDTRKRAEMSGIRDFITKPVRIEDLKRLFTKHFTS